MVQLLARNWAWVLVRGIVALFLGIVVFVWPALSLALLVMIFAAYVFVDGISMALAAVLNRHGEAQWGSLILGAAVAIAAGIAVLVVPGLTAVALLVLIAVWSLIIGGAEIVAAMRLRAMMMGAFLLVLAGLTNVALGVILLAGAGAGALAMAPFIGGYGIIAGIFRIGLALGLRSWRPAEAAGGPPPMA